MDAAKYYDKIYSFKNYEQEASNIARIIGQRCQLDSGNFLDVACGTGKHIKYWKDQSEVEGLDIARVRNPNVRFHQADMTGFDLGKRFNVITCLFSAIGYAKTYKLAASAIA